MFSGPPIVVPAQNPKFTLWGKTLHMVVFPPSVAWLWYYAPTTFDEYPEFQLRISSTKLILHVQTPYSAPDINVSNPSMSPKTPFLLTVAISAPPVIRFDQWKPRSLVTPHKIRRSQWKASCSPQTCKYLHPQVSYTVCRCTMESKMMKHSQ